VLIVHVQALFRGMVLEGARDRCRALDTEKGGGGEEVRKWRRRRRRRRGRGGGRKECRRCVVQNKSRYS